MKNKEEKRAMRKRRVRKTVFGNTERPRMTVFKSNKYMYVQIIDDTNSKTLVAMSTQKMKSKGDNVNANVKTSFDLGEKIAEMALKKKIKSVVFDRSGYRYHGKVKSLADGARKGGLVF